MSNIKNIRDLRENKLKKMSKEEKANNFLKFLDGVKELSLDREKELDMLYKIRGIK